MKHKLDVERSKTNQRPDPKDKGSRFIVKPIQVRDGRTLGVDLREDQVITVWEDTFTRGVKVPSGIPLGIPYFITTCIEGWT